MAYEQEESFSHRFNQDGSIDSICRRCFATVATVKSESELKRPEKDHVCDGWTLGKYGRGMNREK
jgi:hypothetical protein